jgi:catechol 2,3-dioxygenase-like lactoylglutathione lyase family enzyme
VRQLRLVVRADDYERAVSFYRDDLGLPVEEHYTSDGGADVTILGAGRATLELSNPAQIDLIDRAEVGRTGVAPPLRVCFEVDDTADCTARLAAAGAEVIGTPVETPWRSLNARLNAPADLQLTIFSELDARR